MLRSFLVATGLALAFTLGTTDCRAQITTVPSGCPSGGPLVLIPVGNFTIGTTTTVTVVPIGCTGSSISLFLGTCTTPPIPVPRPPACENGCVLGCLPFTVITGPNPFLPVNLTLPNDPSLVGNLTFCMQAACIGTSVNGRTCVELGDKTNVVVQ